MRIRHLAVGVLGIAAVYAAVQVLLAGPGGAPPIADDGTISVTAVEQGRGAWVPYTLTVRNLGTQDFTGRLLMLKKVESPAPTRAKVNVRGFGVLFSPVARGGQTVPPDAAYQFEVALSGRHKQTFSVYAPDDFSGVLVEDGRGRQVAEGQVDDRKSVAVGVLTDSATLPAALEAIRIGEYTTRVTAWGAGQPFPDQAALLSGYSAVVLDRFHSDRLSRAQLAALTAFVGLGGELVVAGAADLPQTLAGLPAALRPISPAGGVWIGSLGPVADLAGLATDLAAPIAAGSAAAGATTILDEADGRPLVLESHYGSGRVVALLFDPDAGASAGTGVAALDQLALTQALGRGLAIIPGADPAGHTLLNAANLPEALFPRPSDAPLPPTWLVGGLILLYLVVVLPLNYLFVRRLRLPPLFWLTAPLLAVAFTFGSYAMGQVLRSGVSDREIQFYRVGPDGIVSRTDVHGIVFPSRGDHRLTFGADGLVAPLTITFPDLTPSCDGCLFPGASGTEVEEHVLPGSPPVVSERAVGYGAVRVVGSASAGQGGLSLVAHLSSVAGRIQGSVANTGKVSISGIIVYSYYQGAYRAAVLAQGLAPGAAVQVDAMPAPIGDAAPRLPPGASLSGGQEISLIADEAGRRTLSHPGELALVGFVRPVNSGLRVDGTEPAGTVTAVFGMPVGLESASGRLGEVAVPRLAGFYPDQAGGNLRDTYDVTLPPATGPFLLRYDRRLYSDVQVYDWAARAWLPGPFADDPASGIVRLAQLTPGEVHQGLVRVRVTEISLSFGSEITVRFPGESP